MTSKIAKITPLIRLPSMVDVFDYFVPPDLEDKIKLGQIVCVPWRNRYVSGVVLGLLDVPSPLQGEGRACPVLDTGVRVFRARPVKKIIDLQPVLTSAQLGLIKQFSDYYLVAPGSVARLIVPARPARISQPRAATIPNQRISFQIAKSQLPLLDRVTNPLLSNLSPEALAKGEEGPGVVLKGRWKFLEIQDISSFVWFIFYLIKKQSGFPPPFAKGGGNDNGTILLLLPTINLIDIFTAALIKYQAQTAVIHSGLSLGAYWQAYQKILRGQAKIILSTRQGAFLPIPTDSTIILFDAASQDFKQYDQHPRYDARTVATWMADLTKSQLILINPSPLPLGEGGVRGALPPATRHKTAIQLVDMKQKLQSPEFDIISDEAIDEIRQAQTLHKKTVIIALRQQADKGVSVNKIKDVLTKLVKDGKNDIIVGTSDVLDSGQLLPYRGQIACLILASIEPLLAIPDFRAGERAFYRLKHWQLWAQELAIPKILLQSYSPDNLVVRAFVYNETEHFISAELETRKRFAYPPFSQLIKLTYQGKDENEIARVAALLKARASDKLIVRGPYQAHKSEKKSILLKIKNSADLSPLATLSSDWAIDRDPENVL